MLYHVREIYIDDEGDTSEHQYIVDRKQKKISRKHHKLTCAPITDISQVTLEQLTDAIASDFENANYHNMTGIGELMATYITRVVGAEVAKQVIWTMINEKGLMLGL